MDARILNEFRAIVGPSGLITEREQLSTYECDGLMQYRVVPAVAVAVRTAAGKRRPEKRCSTRGSFRSPVLAPRRDGGLLRGDGGMGGPAASGRGCSGGDDGDDDQIRCQGG